MSEAALTDARILIVDDQPANVTLLERMLEQRGYTDVVSTNDPTEVVALCERLAPDLLLLDLHMPRLDGFALMQALAPWASEQGYLPILVLTADISQEAKQRALAMGAKDFLTKPLNPTEVFLRVKNLLEARQLHLQLHRHNAELEQRVRVRTADLEQSRLEILDRLAQAAEYRDDETQQHARRIGRAAGALAHQLGLPAKAAREIRRAAPLHDIGKIGIPDQILLKPGKLTDEEFDVIRTHTTIGAQLLSGSQAPLLQRAEEIALTHHERWDGSGYPNGLAGDRIPIAGRIVSVVDVFDALTHDRPYKDAWPIGEAVEEILRQAGRQFDPAVVEAFQRLDHAALLEAIPAGSDDGDIAPRAARDLRVA
jgi:putative two-component system response regulator